MAERKLSIKLSVENAETVKRALETIGKDGQAALKAIEAGSAPASRGLLRLDEASRRLQSSLKGALERATSFRAILASVAGTSGLGLLLRNALASADALQDSADKLGLNTERLQELRFAAGQTGIGIEALDQSLVIFSDNIANAGKGTGTAVDAFKKFGIPIKDVAGNLRPLPDLLLEVAEAIRAVEDPAQRINLARDLFGKGGAELLPLLIQGREGIDALSESARRLGVVLDDAVVKRAADASDQLDALGESVKANFNIGIIEGFSGAFGTIADLLKDPQFQQSVRAFGENVGALLKFVVDNGADIIRVFATIKGALVGGGAGFVLGGPPGAAAGAVLGGTGALALTNEALGSTNVLGLRAQEIAEQAVRDRLAAIEAEIANPVRGGRFNRGSDLGALGDERARLQGMLDQIEGGREAARFARAGGSAGGGGGVPVDPGSIPEHAGEAAREAKSALDALLVSMQREFDQLGLTNSARERAEIVIRAQDAAQQDYDNKLRASPILTGEELAALDRSIAKRQELVAVTNDAAAIDAIWADMQKEATAIIEGLGGAAAKFARELREINTLQRAGRLTPDQAAQAAAELGAQFDGQADALGDLKEAGQDFAHVISTAFEDALLRVASFHDLLGSIEDDLLRIAQRVLVTKPLENWLTQLLGGATGGGAGLNASIESMIAGNPDLFGASVSSSAGGGAGGGDLLTQIFGAGGWIGNLFGFAEGGRFKVGGSGGIDSQIVAFRASPDETVTVERPGQDIRSEILAMITGRSDWRGLAAALGEAGFASKGAAEQARAATIYQTNHFGGGRGGGFGLSPAQAAQRLREGLLRIRL